MRKSRHAGNVFLEYLLLTLMVAFGCLWFYDNGNYQGVRGNVDSSFNNMINELTTP
jgi:hypothetical protein